MKPSEAKEKYGATHYSAMKNGKTPQLYYREPGVSPCWCYLTFADSWHGSFITETDSKKLIKIT